MRDEVESLVDLPLSLNASRDHNQTSTIIAPLGRLVPRPSAGVCVSMNVSLSFSKSFFLFMCVCALSSCPLPPMPASEESREPHPLSMMTHYKSSHNAMP